MASKAARQRLPATPQQAAAADPRTLDLAHLTRYSMGNRALEVELLGMFRDQMRLQARAISQATDAEAWRFATHTLKGVARSLGAWLIAETAERLEGIGHTGNCPARRRLFAELDERVQACEGEIDRLMGRLDA